MSVMYQNRQPKIINNYLFGPSCGRGSFGRVKECWECGSGQRLAIKIYSFQPNLPIVTTTTSINHTELEPSEHSREEYNRTSHSGNLPRLLNQRHSPISRENALKILKSTRDLRHPNVIGLREILHDPVRNKMYCVYESCCSCSLGDFPRLVRSATNIRYGQTLKCIFYQIILGLEYLHGKHIVHKDIKPENILLTEQGIVKIIDFDVSEKFSKFEPTMPIKTRNSSPIIQSPECLHDVSFGGGGGGTTNTNTEQNDNNNNNNQLVDQINGELVDVWGLGVTLYYCAYGTYPFYSDISIFELFKRILHQPVVFPDVSWHSQPTDIVLLEDLLRGCLEKRPEKRLTIAQIKKHPWFAGMNVNLEFECQQLANSIPRQSDWDLMQTISEYMQNKAKVRYRKVAKIF